MNRARVERGVPAGGQFTATGHPEAALDLASVRHPELEAYGDIPAPREDQTFADGTPVPEGSFQDAYEAFFKPLNDYEAEHGPYKPQPGPTEAELQALAGLADINLGREHGTSLEEDENGDAVIVVHTRNGGGNRECWDDDCDGTCTACIQTNLIPSLPTYLRDEDDEGDSTYADNYFRAADVEAGRAAVAAARTQRQLILRNHIRRGIAEGECAPWEILSPVHGDEVPYELRKARSEALAAERDHERYVRYAGLALSAVQAGTKLPKTHWSLRGPASQISYDIAIEYIGRYRAEAADASSRHAALAAEISGDLPPTVRALADTELERLSAIAEKSGKRLAEQTAKVARLSAEVQAWAQDQLNATSRHAEKTAAATAAIENFNWARSWPGELADCPPKPAAAQDTSPQRPRSNPGLLLRSALTTE